MTQVTATKPQLPPFDHTPAPYTGPDRDEVLALRREYLTPALVTMYRKPLLVVEGKMQYLFDETGRRYLDGFGGIVSVSVGHCHPRVLEAVREQNERLQHTTTIYLHPNIGLFGKKLARTMPEGSGLGVVYFVNSGSEANDLAILMARAFTGNYDVIATPCRPIATTDPGGTTTPTRVGSTPTTFSASSGTEPVVRSPPSSASRCRGSAA